MPAWRMRYAGGRRYLEHRAWRIGIGRVAVTAARSVLEIMGAQHGTMLLCGTGATGKRISCNMYIAASPLDEMLLYSTQAPDNIRLSFAIANRLNVLALCSLDNDTQDGGYHSRYLIGKTSGYYQRSRLL